MQFKIFSILGLFGLTWVFACACSDSDGSGKRLHKADETEVGRDLPSSARNIEAKIQDNPLAIPYTGFEKTEEPSRSKPCVHFDLRVENRGSRYLAGNLIATNQCGLTMAILVSPVKLYYRRNDSEFFVDETLITPVYIVFYIFRTDLGIGPKAFLGDGGLEVYGWPEYASILGHSSVRIPLIDRQGVLAKLAPGQYGARISTWVAPTTSARNSVPPIDLGMDVSRFNRGYRTGRMDIRPGSARLTSTIATFQISDQK